MYTRAEAAKDKQIILTLFARDSAIQQDMDRRASEYFASQRACGCSPLCAFHENWRLEMVQLLTTYQAELAQNRTIIQEIRERMLAAGGNDLWYAPCASRQLQ